MTSQEKKVVDEAVLLLVAGKTIEARDLLMRLSAEAGAAATRRLLRPRRPSVKAEKQARRRLRAVVRRMVREALGPRTSR